jgi:hypothetical protein
MNMEGAMTRQDAIGALLGRLRDWWRRQEELRALSDKQGGLIAADLGINIETLKDLLARGPKATKRLYERMLALGYRKPTSTGLRMASCANCKGRARAAMSRACATGTWQSAQTILCGRLTVPTPTHLISSED